METYELLIGRPPFEADLNNNELIPKFQTVIGNVPEAWICQARSKGIIDEDFNGRCRQTLPRKWAWN